MVFSKNFLLSILQVAWLLFPWLIQAQDQSGFISIDCGLSDATIYTDETTGIRYVSDANFTEFGENREISPKYKGQTDARQFWTVRAFPQGMKNCYTLRPSQDQGTTYFIRARFMYGNYDNRDQKPLFDLYLGVDLWDTVKIEDSDTIITKGIIHTPSSDYIHVCLVSTGYGNPFISVLELRPFGTEVFTSKTGSSLKLVNHYDFSSSTNQVERYKDDVYDRLWFPLYTDKWTPFRTVLSSDQSSISKDEFEVPSSVMGTAYTRNATINYMYFSVSELNSSSLHFIYMYFAELEILASNQSREFIIYANEDSWDEPFSPRYLKTDTMYNSKGIATDKEGVIEIWLNNTKTATLPPLINAMEVYELKELSGQDTSQTDVEAIMGVKLAYGLNRITWQGDPCGPYIWDGLDCTNTDHKTSQIGSLNLSSSGLKGEIAPSIANLTMLEYLDLSSNNLTGSVPEFLASLKSLKLLNLTGNNFTHPLPKALLSKKGLTLSVDGYLNDATSCSSCGAKQSFVVPLVSSLGGVLFIVVIIAAVIWSLKNRRKQDATQMIVETASVEPKEEDDQFGSKSQQFSYSEIERMTGKFKTILGEGGFGKVYHGYLNGKEVAVKMLSSPTIQGHRQFHTELKLLMRVHHKNLTTLVGYCNEGTNVGLIYEYMAMGNLRSHISGSISKSILSWGDRLRIAIDTAQGLEYLHNGCKPPIIHRDVKSTNILLTDKFQAKLGDFGLSKIFPFEGGNNHTSTYGTPGITSSIAGTPGYLDPEYYVTNWLNEKSDVYSFGVVLLEIITARPVLTKTRENSHIIQWVSSMLATGDIINIVDPRIDGDYDINTVWKAIEISMACVSKTSNNRPTMSRVTTELKECLTTELIRRDNGRDVADFSKDSSVEIISRIMTSEFSPTAR